MIDKVQRESLLLMLESIEYQIVGIKRILGLVKNESPQAYAVAKRDENFGYTTDAEDDSIAAAMALDKIEKTDAVLQDIVLQSQNRDLPESDI